ncbi:FUSC family protein [Devosia alba]|uniref:FUSC family protein n=1 Tax=Devosia alba TaxID=3152360 RepID=UPI003267DE27
MANLHSRYRWLLVHSVRMTLGGVAAFALARALGLPEGLSATITAILVTQSNVEGSLRRAFDQFIGALFGAVYAAGIALAIAPDDALSTALALGIALAPLTILATRSAGFLVAPITAAVVLLGGSGLDLTATGLAVYRIAGVTLGCGIALLVSVLIAPARASRLVGETASQIARLMGEQLQALASSDLADHAVLNTKSSETRRKLIRLAALVDQTAQERLQWRVLAPAGQNLLLTLRRVRHDVDVLRRAAREVGSDALRDSAATTWQYAARCAAATLTCTSQLLVGQPVPEDFNTLAPAVRGYKVAVDEMRRTGVTNSLSTAALERLFGLGFALEQLRRDLDELIELARETSSART